VLGRAFVYVFVVLSRVAIVARQVAIVKAGDARGVGAGLLQKQLQ